MSVETAYIEATEAVLGERLDTAEADAPDDDDDPFYTEKMKSILRERFDRADKILGRNQ